MYALGPRPQEILNGSGSGYHDEEMLTAYRSLLWPRGQFLKLRFLNYDAL